MPYIYSNFTFCLFFCLNFPYFGLWRTLFWLLLLFLMLVWLFDEFFFFRFFFNIICGLSTSIFRDFNCFWVGFRCFQSDIPIVGLFFRTLHDFDRFPCWLLLFWLSETIFFSYGGAFRAVDVQLYLFMRTFFPLKYHKFTMVW